MASLICAILRIRIILLEVCFLEPIHVVICHCFYLVLLYNFWNTFLLFSRPALVGDPKDGRSVIASPPQSTKCQNLSLMRLIANLLSTSWTVWAPPGLSAVWSLLAPICGVFATQAGDKGVSQWTTWRYKRYTLQLCWRTWTLLWSMILEAEQPRMQLHGEMYWTAVIKGAGSAINSSGHWHNTEWGPGFC